MENNTNLEAMNNEVVEIVEEVVNTKNGLSVIGAMGIGGAVVALGIGGAIAFKKWNANRRNKIVEDMNKAFEAMGTAPLDSEEEEFDSEDNQ